LDFPSRRRRRFDLDFVLFDKNTCLDVENLSDKQAICQGDARLSSRRSRHEREVHSFFTHF
jgi:hypothetical protein